MHRNIYLNTANCGTEIKLTDEFKKKFLLVPLTQVTQDTTQFISTAIEGEILFWYQHRQCVFLPL